MSVECLYNWGDGYLYCFVYSGILWSAAWLIWWGGAGMGQWGELVLHDDVSF